MKIIAFTAILACAPAAATAQSLDSIEKAQALGSILAAEEFCDLAYNQDAISAWIDENTDPSDMMFSSTLNMMTEVTTYEQDDMSESSKTALCRSVTRTARHYRFIQ